MGEPEAKLLFVTRLRGINGMHPKTRHIMQVLRLLQINNGVFMRVNKATMNMLVKVDPYIMYGYPNLKTVKDLVYKRGFAKVNGQRVPLTDNSIVENALSEKTKGAVICMEDLIHEIYTVGPYFKECTKFLWPFKMNCPIGGFSRIRTTSWRAAMPVTARSTSMSSSGACSSWTIIFRVILELVCRFLHVISYFRVLGS